jgi:hypothetical protein
MRGLNMNPLIKTQLNKIRTVKIPPYEDNTTSITIPMRTPNDPIILEEDKCYLIQVEDYILNPPDGFTLHTNWNHNKIPKCKYMKIDVNKIMGKMIKVNSIGYDMDSKVNINEMWEGWLPEKSIIVLERL